MTRPVGNPILGDIMRQIQKHEGNAGHLGPQYVSIGFLQRATGQNRHFFAGDTFGKQIRQALKPSLTIGIVKRVPFTHLADIFGGMIGISLNQFPMDFISNGLPDTGLATS